MMRVLAFDTSAAHVAATLLIDGTVAAHAHEDMTRGQAERLMPMLGEVLTAGGATWGDLTRIGVGIGPGNFTGIRISVSAARGLALGLGIPAIGVSALAAQAYGLDNVMSCLPAPRDQTYMQILSPGADNTPVLCRLDPDMFPDWNRDLHPSVVGPNADVVAGLINAAVVASKFPLTEAIARIASTSQDTQTRPAPLYLKPADAAPSRDVPPTILT